MPSNKKIKNNKIKNQLRKEKREADYNKKCKTVIIKKETCGCGARTTIFTLYYQSILSA
jgi:hypothetical protein